MTLELANRSVAYPVGVAEYVFMKVGKLHFLANFVVVDYDVDPRVPLILERPLLRTAQALINVHVKELTLQVNDEAITFNYAQEVLEFSDSSKSGNPTLSLDPISTTSSPTLTPFEVGDFVLEEIEACLTSDSIPSGIDDAEPLIRRETIFTRESYLHDDPSSHFSERTMLKRLAGNEYYCFLDGFSRYFQISIDPQDQEKTTFTCPYGTFAYRRMPFGLCNALGTFQRCMMAIFHDMIEETMEVFMDDFSVFGDSFSSCLSHLDKMLKSVKTLILFLIGRLRECDHCMVKKGIVLGHKISKSRIEVDRAKVDVIAKLPHPIRFKRLKLKKKLTEAPILVAPDWDLPFEIMCDASDFAVGAVLGQRDLEKKEINETFPLETLEMISFHGDSSTSWFADIANYHAGKFIVKGMSS
ncbi:reverse transcriptase domain-containing protein [Tanacetum coccineum]